MTVVALRVDASRDIGSGHLKRCLSLAKALSLCGAHAIFVCRPLDKTASGLLAGMDVQWLPEPAQPAAYSRQPVDPEHAAWAGVSWQQDAGDTAGALRSLRVDWLVVDHYAFEARWHGAIRQALGCRIAVIDDLADRPLAADLLIDPNWHADHAQQYRAVLQRPTPSLFGPRFALLDLAYAQAPKYSFHAAVRSIGIFMGGTDPANATEAALAACRAAGFTGPIEMVSTEANPHVDRLRALCAASADTSLSVGLPDLADFFARHDLQIGAGGGATWERCCIGAPTLAVVLAPNQRATIPALEQLGALYWSRSMAPDAWGADIARLLAAPELRQRLAAAALELVDGLGAWRVALRMLRDSLAVRPATLGDAAMVYGWRNHPATRATAADPAPIGYAAHESWMRATLADPARHLLIANIGTQPVGVIRFDLAAGPEATVSLYLAPAWPGLGLGGRMLAAGENFLAERIRGKCALQARVLPGNDTSRRMFESAGYTGGPEAYTKWLAPAGPAKS